MANKAYKFRLYPNEEQKILFTKTFGCVRFVYNKSIIEKKLRLPKVGLVKIVQHRIISGDEKIKSATITRTPSGKYYVSILVEYDKIIPEIELSKDKVIGLDYASHSFYVDSQGREADYPKFYRKAQDKLAREQRKLANMKYGSNNYHKQKIKVARVHEKVANQRLDWIHKLSIQLANEYDIVCVEDMNMQNMARSLKLGKSTNDNGFGMFRDILACKLADRGKAFVKIDKWFPSSKMCRHCGSINHELTLSDRVWTCGCGATINRDENAAINIMNEGLRMLFS